MCQPKASQRKSLVLLTQFLLLLSHQIVTAPSSSVSPSHTLPSASAASPEGTFSASQDTSPNLPSLTLLAPPLSGLEEPLEAAGGAECTRGQVCLAADDVTQLRKGIGVS